MPKSRAIGSDLKCEAVGFLQHSSSSAILRQTEGEMGMAVGGVVNSISRFIHFVSCQSMKSFPAYKDYRDMVSALKLLKPVLDEVINCKIPADELLLKEFEELDFSINEARDFLERWGVKMSKICSVLQSGPLVVRVQRSSLQICCILTRLLQQLSFGSYLTCIQLCMQELKCVAEEERISDLIEEAFRDQRDCLMPNAKRLLKLAESLGLMSNHELFLESIALEKEISKAEIKNNKEEESHFSQIIDLMSQIRDCVGEHFREIHGVTIPSYFLCPLSLEPMVDPVIVASGQTYERASIQKWLDHGLRVCPKSRQTLSHANLIPNYTVKALISSWCEDKDRRCSKSFLPLQSPSPGCCNDLNRIDGFRGSLQSNNTSSSFVEAGSKLETPRMDFLSRSEMDSYSAANIFCENTLRDVVVDKVALKTDPSFDRSYTHSSSESVSSAISTVEDMLSRESSKFDDVHEVSGEVSSNCTVSSLNKSFPPRSSRNQNQNVNGRMLADSGDGIYHCSISSQSDSSYDEVTTFSHVQKLVEDLNSNSNETQTAAAVEIRLLTKHNMENRIVIAKCGAIGPLVSLLYSGVKVTQENAVTALLNLSINDNNKTAIAEAGAMEPLIHVLKSGDPEAKENSAATLFSLSVLEEYKIKIGRSGAVKALVDLLGNGTLRGKKDAATALFNLSIFHENKARIVQAGAVKYLVELIDPATGMSDKAVALLANLATVPEGRAAIAREGGIPLLVEVVDTGSQRGKENAASSLLQLCINSKKFCALVLQEGAVPPLVALSQSGTPRAKEKAQQILSHFRNQREGINGKVK